MPLAADDGVRVYRISLALGPKRVLGHSSGNQHVASVPWVGDVLVRVLRGGDTLGALTLSRFFAVHTLFLPTLIVSGIVLHLFILRRVGPAGPWEH